MDNYFQICYELSHELYVNVSVSEFIFLGVFFHYKEIDRGYKIYCRQIRSCLHIEIKTEANLSNISIGCTQHKVNVNRSVSPFIFVVYWFNTYDSPILYYKLCSFVSYILIILFIFILEMKGKKGQGCDFLPNSDATSVMYHFIGMFISVCHKKLYNHIN